MYCWAQEKVPGAMSRTVLIVFHPSLFTKEPLNNKNKIKEWNIQMLATSSTTQIWEIMISNKYYNLTLLLLFLEIQHLKRNTSFNLHHNIVQYVRSMERTDYNQHRVFVIAESRMGCQVLWFHRCRYTRRHVGKLFLWCNTQAFDSSVIEGTGG